MRAITTSKWFRKIALGFLTKWNFCGLVISYSYVIYNLPGNVMRKIEMEFDNGCLGRCGLYRGPKLKIGNRTGTNNFLLVWTFSKMERPFVCPRGPSKKNCERVFVAKSRFRAEIGFWPIGSKLIIWEKGHHYMFCSLGE